MNLIGMDLDHFSQGQEKRIRHGKSYLAKALSVFPCRRFTASRAERNRCSRSALFTGEMIKFFPSVAISRGVSIVILKRSSTGLSMIRAALLPCWVNRLTMTDLQ